MVERYGLFTLFILIHGVGLFHFPYVISLKKILSSLQGSELY